MSPDPLTIQLLQRGFQARQAGRLDEACTALEQALVRSPEQPDALYLLGEIAQARGDTTAAAAWLERSVRSRSNQPLAWCRLGEALESLGQPTQALAAYGEALRWKPDLGVAHYNRARLLVAEGRPGEARQALLPVLSGQPSPPALRSLALQLRAQLEEADKDLPAALATLAEALQLTPARAALHHNRGALLNQLARPDEALAAFDQAQTLGLDAAELHYNRGNSLQAIGRSADAMAAYRAALARQPLHTLALYDLARLRWRQGDTDFDQELQEAVARHPESAVAAGLLGRLLLHAERFAQAQQAYETACRLDDGQAGFFDGLGQALGRQGLTEAAVTAHERAAALPPPSAAAHIGLAAACLRAGRIGHAQSAAESALALDGNDQHAWALLGLVWRLNADPRDAWLHDYRRHVQVLDLPAPPGFADMAAFNTALAAELEALHRDRRAPIDQTLRVGSQTVGNLLDRETGALGLLKRRLSEGIEAYVQHLDRLGAEPGQADLHPLLHRPRRGWRFSDSWSSRLRSGGFHTSHVHPHGWISASYYVLVPPVVQDGPAEPAAEPRPGWITFGRPDIQVPGRSLEVQHAVQPVAGRLVLFPSYMWHDTVPFEDAGPRLTVAFDVLPEA